VSETTTIEWTDATWSPWEGCTKVSPGCDHCYAEGMNRWLRKGENWGPGAPRRIYSSDHWDKPVRWNDKAKAEGRRLRVFPSVCDPFDNEVAPVIRRDSSISSGARRTSTGCCSRSASAKRLLRQARDAIDDRDRALWLWITEWYREGNPPRNVWLGATVVNQEEADRDIPKLLDIPARVRFLSCEPLLGPIGDARRRRVWLRRVRARGLREPP
jgi:protein gp37